MIGRPRKKLLALKLPVALELAAWSMLMQLLGPTALSREIAQQVRRSTDRQLKKRRDAA